MTESQRASGRAHVRLGKPVVLLMESCASEMAFKIRFLLACLAGGRDGLKSDDRHEGTRLIPASGPTRQSREEKETDLRSGLDGRSTRLDRPRPA